MTNEEKAFLDTLSFAEGTFGKSNNGFDILVNNDPSLGDRIMKGWTSETTIQHGLDAWSVKVNGVNSTASGRYQFIGSTWKEINGNNNAPMTSTNQNNAALKLLRKVLGNDFSFEINNKNEMEQIANKIKGKWDSFNVGGKNSASQLFNWYSIALEKYNKG